MLVGGTLSVPITTLSVVGATGFEPVAFSMSRKRATAAPSARDLIIPTLNREKQKKFNGAEGNCTPVRNYFIKSFYKFSPD